MSYVFPAIERSWFPRILELLKATKLRPDTGQVIKTFIHHSPQLPKLQSLHHLLFVGLRGLPQSHIE